MAVSISITLHYGLAMYAVPVLQLQIVWFYNNLLRKH